MISLEQLSLSIDHASSILEHPLGWRFLYSPASTLSSKTRMLFLGLHPVGTAYRVPIASVEEGNAYRLERWGKDGTYSALQEQVIGFFEQIACTQEAIPRDTLMDSCLTADFIPFRAASWKTLVNRNRSMKYAKGLWLSVFNELAPAVIVCLHPDPYHWCHLVLVNNGGREISSNTQVVGSGNVTFAETHFAVGENRLYLVLLPNLSRYHIIGDERFAVPVNRITSEIATRLSD